jgi:hypothetical protein
MCELQPHSVDAGSSEVEVPCGSLLDEWPQITEKPATEDHFRKPLHQRDGNCKRTAAEEWSDQQKLRNITAVGDCAGQHPAYAVRLPAEKGQAAGDCHRQLLEQRSTAEFCSKPFQKVSAEFHGSGQQQLLQKLTAPGGSEQVDQTPACEEVYMQQQPSAAGFISLAQGQHTPATEFSSVEPKEQTMLRQSSSLKVKETSALGSLLHQQPESSCQLVKQNFSIR